MKHTYIVFWPNVCVVGAGIMGVDGYAGMSWGGYMYICLGFNFVIS